MSIKTSGPEIELQRTILQAIVSAGLPVSDTLQILGNIAAAALSNVNAMAHEDGLKLLAHVARQRLLIERQFKDTNAAENPDA